MTETNLPDEFEEQALFYALGILSPEGQQAFMHGLQGESVLLQQTVNAYCAITGTLTDTVTPVAPPVALRQRLVDAIALEASREAEQFERIVNTLAIGSVPVKPRDSVRERLLSRVDGHSNVHIDVEAPTTTFSDLPTRVSGSEGLEQRNRLSPQTGEQSGWLESCWKAVSTFLRTLLIRSIIPRPSSNGLTFVKASEGTWRRIAQGVQAKLLSFDPISRRTTTLLRFAPGTRYAPHRHAAVEELYVLEGGCFIAGREMTVGDYHRAEAGTVHHDTSTDEGCLLLAISSPQNEMV